MRDILGWLGLVQYGMGGCCKDIDVYIVEGVSRKFGIRVCEVLMALDSSDHPGV